MTVPKVLLTLAVVGACVGAWWLLTKDKGPDVPGRSGPSANDRIVAPLAANSGTHDPAGQQAGASSADRQIVTAPTASAPLLTLPGAILAVLAKSPMGTDRYVPTSPNDVGRVLADRVSNPERKILSAAAERELAAIVARQNADELELVQRDGVVTKEALHRAVADGQIESMEMVAPSMTVSTGEASRENAERARRLEEGLHGRFGEFLEDWAGSQFGTTEPDGVARSSLVYFTRRQAPEVFEIRANYKAMGVRHRAECAEFVRQQPGR